MDPLDLDIYLSQIAAGDSDAFGRWVAATEFPLRRLLRRYAAVVDVESVLQEALLRTWQVAPRVTTDGKPNALLRLALRIAVNLAIDAARRHRRSEADVEALLAAPREIYTPTPPDPFLRAALLECRQKLPKKLGAALTARLQNGASEPDSQLARRLKMQLNTFLQNVTRARRFLADCLRRRGINLEDELA